MSENEMRGKVVLAGGSGYLGRLLTAHFVAQGRPVVVLSRHKLPDTATTKYVAWDGESVGPWVKELDGADAIINLSGRSVNCRYNERNKQEILRSRLRPTEIIGQGLLLSANPPKVWLNASSATIYREAPDMPMDETVGEPGWGFSVEVCEQWENMLFSAPLKATRKVALRLAIVFGRDGDAFKTFRCLVNFGLGGKMGPGDQFVSWIHEEDFVRAVDFVIATEKLQGPVNLTAPDPLPNKEFMRVFRRVCRRPIGLPSAVWMLKIGAALMGTELELILKSRRVIPGKLSAHGFQFKYPKWREALENLVRGETAAETKSE